MRKPPWRVPAALSFALLGALDCGGGTSKTGSPAATSPSGKIYVTVYGTDQVEVFDATTHAALPAIALGSGRGPAILLKTPDGKKLYSANWKDNTISAIDLSTSGVTTIQLDSRPWVVAMSPAGDVVYAGLNSNKIAVISTTTDAIARNIDTGGLLPESIIVSPDGATLYVAIVDQNSIGSLLGGTIEAISSSTGAIVHPALTVGMTPAWITISADGATVFTLNFLSNDVSVVDTAMWKLSNTIPVGSNAEPIIGAVAPGGPLVVTNFGSANVAIVDPATGAVVHTFPTSGRPVGIDFSADGAHGYVTDFGANSLTVPLDPLDIESGDLTSAIGTGPGEIVEFDPSTGAVTGAPITTMGAGPTSIVVE